jgi:hypothetical protein
MLNKPVSQSMNSPPTRAVQQSVTAQGERNPKKWNEAGNIGKPKQFVYRASSGRL